MQISVVAGSTARALHNIIQLLLLLEHTEELVQLQCDPDVFWPGIPTKAIADPFPDVGVHCTRACLLQDPTPNIDLCVQACSAELLGDDASIEPRVFTETTQEHLT